MDDKNKRNLKSKETIDYASNFENKNHKYNIIEEKHKNNEKLLNFNKISEFSKDTSDILSKKIKNMDDSMNNMNMNHQIEVIYT